MTTARPMAMPRATAMPCTENVIARSLPFAEPVADQREQRVHRFLLALAVGLDRDLGAYTGGQHHDAHDALGIDAARAATEPDVAREAARQLGELGRGARMQAQLIADGRGFLDHGSVGAG